MSRKLFLNHCGFIVTLFLLWSTGARAQITISSSNILGIIGKSETVENDTTNAITVNVGTAGANRTWDFRTLVLKAERFTYQFIAPAGTPFAARVPLANFVQKIISPSQPNSAFYSYLLVSANGLRSLGSGTVSPQGNFFRFANAQDLAPLPLAFNATWTSVESDTTGNIQTGASISSRNRETNPNYTTATNFIRLFSRTTSVASPRAAENIPTDFALAQNFPNPFNPATEISFQLARAGRVELAIFNVAGEKVRTLISGNVAPGSHAVKWDGKDEGGRRLASGTYVYQLKAGNFSEAKKMLLLQ